MATRKKKTPVAERNLGRVAPVPSGWELEPPPETGYESPLLEVPYGSYDPSIEAQRKAAERGLSDLREDSKTAGHWSKRDLKTSLGDIRRRRGRTVRDVRRSRRRENQKLDFRDTDLRQDAGRNRQDFATRLSGIRRKFSRLAGTQQEARNAAGTLRGGTARAAAQKRAQNRALAEAPVNVAAGRMEEDLKTSLGRIRVTRGQVNTDARRALRRDKVDTKRDRKLTKRDYGRDKFERGRKLNRGKREQIIGDADLTAQKIDSARQRNPGTFSKYGKKKNKKKKRKR